MLSGDLPELRSTCNLMTVKPLKPQYQLFAEAIAKGMTGEEAVKAAGYKARGQPREFNMRA